MAINFNDQNQGIGSLDLGQFGMQQPEENMQVAEAFNFGLLPQATENFKPDFGGMFDSTQNLGNNYKGTSKADFINAIQSGAFGVGGREMFDRNVGDVFEGVNLDKKGYNPFSNVSPTLTGTEDGTFRGAIDIDKGSLSPEAIKNLPADFFKSIGDQSSLGLPTNDRYASLSSYFTPTTMNDASNNTMINADSVLKTPSRLFGGVTQPSKRFKDHSNMKSFLQANPDMGQNIKDKIGSVFNQGKQGILNNPLVKGAGMAFNAATGNIPGLIMGGIGMLGNQFEDKTLYGDTIDENGNVYSADQLNSLNALGGGYTDPARSARRRTLRISKMRARDFNNKKISQTNLNRLVKQEKAQQAAREASTAARARAANASVYANADAGGFTRGGGGFASHNTGTNSNFSNKSGRGRTGYQEGGLASMFTRRR